MNRFNSPVIIDVGQVAKVYKVNDTESNDVYDIEQKDSATVTTLTHVLFLF